MIEDDSKVGCVQLVYPEQGVHYKEFDDVSVFYLLLKGVSVTPWFLFTSGDDKLNCLKKAPKNA